jgi:hypothetical protein
MPITNQTSATGASPALTAHEAPSSEAATSFKFRHSAFFDFQDAPLYRKKMSLPKTNVEVALAEKEIVTIVGKQSDFQETKNTAHIGDHIVTAPATGERYVLTSANFHTKYEQDPEDRDSYRSTNVVRVVRLGDDTEIKAPWGSPQYAKKGGYAAQSVTDEHDIYLIEENAFASTYRPLPMAKPYGHDRDRGVVDPANKHF